MELVDTNIIIYALGKDHSYKESCANIIKNIGEGLTEYNINIEVLQEILYVYSSRGERIKGIEIIDRLLVLFPNPLPITVEEIKKAKDLMKVYDSLIARDAIHAAIVFTKRLDGILSTDKIFDTIKGIKRIDPKSVK